jgi:hypothetical protein
MAPPPLIAQTLYAELLDRCTSASFGTAFGRGGNFVAKTKKGREGIRRYWYFQEQAETGRKQRYVGPETPELLERISKHKEIRYDQDACRKLISALVHTYGMPRPLDEIGRIIAALADAGAFRLRAVLVGTCAYQSYAAMLGVRLPSSVLMTEDVDIAQFRNVSLATEDAISPPLLDTLKAVDLSFAPVPHPMDSRRSTSYRNGRGTRVDFLTPNEGSDSDEPQHLPTLPTDSQPLRFLDFLIHDAVPAVVLHGAGILVLVPTPERYAVHKLIVARRRQAGSGKKVKDIEQAQALIPALANSRLHELRAVWDEAVERGGKWKRYLIEGLAELASAPRDSLLKVVQLKRGDVPGLALSFERTAARYDFDRDVVIFAGSDRGGHIRCGISREALDDHYGEGATQSERLAVFAKYRDAIERLTIVKYLKCPIEEPGVVLIKTSDVEMLGRLAEN